MIPIRNRWGRIIAYTARHIGHNPKAPKYINSSTSPVYSKGETLFGIDRASRQRNADYFIIVEGAPDVLRMQSVGFDNTVAALGTAWTDSQFEQLKKYTSSLCFIPDSDVTEGKPYGAGFEAVMANGAMAIRKGFHVTVRELPFVKASVVGENIPSEDTFQVKFVKMMRTVSSRVKRITPRWQRSISSSGWLKNVFLSLLHWWKSGNAWPK